MRQFHEQHNILKLLYVEGSGIQIASSALCHAALAWTIIAFWTLPTENHLGGTTKETFA